MKAVAPVLGLFAAVFALATPATAVAAPSASATSDVEFAQADLNGDGTLDLVSLRPSATDPSKQILTGVVGRQRYNGVIPMDEYFGVQPLRVGDVDGNGRADIFVTEVVGANTDWRSVWELGQFWLPVRHPDGTEMQLLEGGGVSAVVGYGCEVVDGQRQLFTVSGELGATDPVNLYAGDKVNYVVEDGEAVEVSRQSIAGTRDVFPADHATCA